MTRFVMFRKPSAFVPVAMSILALATVLIYVTKFGVVPQPDEGTAAHLWQLLMVAQVPIIAFFAIKWIPQTPKEAIPVLVFQVLAVLAAAAPVYFLGF
jgi:hypothetical protein